MDLSALSPVQRKMADAVLQKCAVSRVWFVEKVLGAKLEQWQRTVLEELDAGVTKKSIRSGHGVGKTTLCAWCALHYLVTRDDVKIIVTSPSFNQLSDGLIPEITKWVSKLPAWMSGSLDITSERMVRNPNYQNNFISFRTARKENPEALAGVHATFVMIIVDEASGVDEVVYETGQGSLSTPGAICLLIGNPTRPAGFFYKTQTILADLWNAMKVSCYDSSRVSEEYIATAIATYGSDSREFRVRVLGEFPESGATAVIPRAFIESAIGRDVVPFTGERVWGVDPGRGGDPSGFVDRSKNYIHAIDELRYDNLMQLVGWIKNRWEATPSSYRPASIFVDSIGLGGGVVDRLAELGLPVVGVNVSEAASMSTRYVRLRPELWYATREWFETMTVAFSPTLEKKLLLRMTEELASPNEKLMDSTGKIDVESKVEIKKRLQRSTNLADALIMTFAHGGAIMNGRGTSGWGKVDTLSYRAPGVV